MKRYHMVDMKSRKDRFSNRYEFTADDKVWMVICFIAICFLIIVATN